MRKIYIFVSLFFVACVLAFIAAFFYLDRSTHKTYYYTVNLNGHDIGSIKIDRFRTEEKILYKSVSDLPFYPLLTEIREKVVLDRKNGLESFSRDASGSGVTHTAILQSDGKTASFMATFDANLLYTDDIQLARESYVFDEASVVTYLPVAEAYDFKKGGIQGFNTLTFLSYSLPPAKKFVTLTSIRNEYVKIESPDPAQRGIYPRKIKTESLLVKMKNYPQATAWVSKYDKSVVKLEIPKNGLVITRSLAPKRLSAADYVITGEGVKTRDITVKAKTVNLAGSFYYPDREGKYPGVLLVWGLGAQDRRCEGLFTSLSAYLAGKDFCVLSLDKRGIGASSGDSDSYTEADTADDIKAALEFLSVQKEVDRERIAVVAHRGGVRYILKMLAEGAPVKALVLMSPSLYIGAEDGVYQSHYSRVAAKEGWRDDYLNLVFRSISETNRLARNPNRDWAFLMGKKAYIKNLREALAFEPLELVKKLSIPTLILQGKKDRDDPLDDAATIEKALGEAGNANRVLTYYGYVGDFFGEAVNDGVRRAHYEPDKDVLQNIGNWLNKNLPEPSAGSPDAAEPPAAAGSVGK